jgi:choline dehydrogenase-like flavoprotein
VPERRLGLVIATSVYDDPKFQQLRSPGTDAKALAELLQDDRIGGFHQLNLLSNPTASELRRAIQTLYRAARPDDLVVTHIACHGVKDDDGNLYFACRDTELDLLEATGVEASFVNGQMARSRCHRKVLFLDCCYSGSFSPGLSARGSDRVDLRERFSGSGQVVLTASNAIEYAFERDAPTGEGVASVFTSALIKGLAGGAADRDGDGWVSVDELYDYVADDVARVTQQQTPSKWSFDVQGSIFIVRSPAGRRATRPGQLGEAPDLSAGTYDVLSRSICSDWLEIEAQQQDGGFPFDAVVIGAGMCGGYCAEKLYRYSRDANLRILVLEAGSFLFPTHIQNLPEPLGGRLAGPSYPRSREDGSGLHNGIWGIPWISNEEFAGLAYCVGGRSLFWGGWSPRLTTVDLTNWPQELRAFLVGPGGGYVGGYDRTEQEIGVAASAQYIVFHRFHDALLRAVQSALPAVASLTFLQEAPLALDAGAPGPLFAYAKFNSADLLVNAVRHAADSEPTGDVNRRLFVVPRTHVLRFNLTSNTVTGIDVVTNGAPKTLSIPPSCAIVLAAGTVETTRLALDSLGVGSATFGSPRVGNLMAHLRSNILVRVKRTAIGLPPIPQVNLETTAFLVRGTSQGRQFHLEVSACVMGMVDPEEHMWKQIPDVELQGQLRTNHDPSWITIILRAIGEMSGQQSLEPDAARSWIELSPETDEYGARRAYVQLVKSPSDTQLWLDMDTAAFELAAALGKQPGDVEFFNGHVGAWQQTPPPIDPETGGLWRDSLGSTHHEAGTLFAGAPGASITDSNGKFHDVTNVFVAGPAVFPTLGSANPSLTALSLSGRTAKAIVAAAVNAPPDSSFVPLPMNPADWQLAARSGDTPQMLRTGGAFETAGGYGLYFYTKEQFANFKLWLEWREAHTGDKSGVFIRTPGPGIANALQQAVDLGHEIQIDDIGAPDGAAIYRTGAIYALQGPTSFPVKPVGEWNTFLIEAKGPHITVTLNGILVNSYVSSREQFGYLALQVHDFPSRAQFRNMRVKELH